jgi:hypothetical protein
VVVAIGKEDQTPEIVGESLAKRLIELGVGTVFRAPGDGINGPMEGFRRHAERLRFVLVHHEEAAAFMAAGPRGGQLLSVPIRFQKSTCRRDSGASARGCYPPVSRSLVVW